MVQVSLAVILIAIAARLDAGVVQGVVLEHISGRPLARAVVRLDPVPQSGAAKTQALTTRAGRSGQFAFHPVPAGLYVLSAVADGYFRSAYGQRLPAGRGMPFPVTDDSQFFAEIRM